MKIKLRTRCILVLRISKHSNLPCLLKRGLHIMGWSWKGNDTWVIIVRLGLSCTQRWWVSWVVLRNSFLLHTANDKFQRFVVPEIMAVFYMKSRWVPPSHICFKIFPHLFKVVAKYSFVQGKLLIICGAFADTIFLDQVGMLSEVSCIIGYLPM